MLKELIPTFILSLTNIYFIVDQLSFYVKPIINQHLFSYDKIERNNNLLGFSFLYTFIIMIMHQWLTIEAKFRPRKKLLQLDCLLRDPLAHLYKILAKRLLMTLSFLF